MKKPALPVITNGFFPTFNRAEHLRLLVKRLGRCRMGLTLKWLDLRGIPTHGHLRSLRQDVVASIRAAVGVAWPKIANYIRRKRLDKHHCQKRNAWARCNHPRGHVGDCWFYNLAGTGWG